MRIKLGVPMSLFDIAMASGGQILTEDNTLISYISTDTREICKGDLFIAIRGESFDGESFVEDAKTKGAFIISKNRNSADIYTPDTRNALLLLAENYVKNLPIILYRIGITGSVGKTTTKEFLKIILEERYKCHASTGNFNNEIGMPMSMLSAPPDTEALIMEMGMNHPGEIRKLSKALRPNIAIITNVGTAHIGNLGSRKNIANAKLEICEGMDDGITIVPSDEPLLASAKNKKTYSFINRNSDYFFTSDSTETLSVFWGENHYCKATFAPEGEHNKICLAAAISAAIESGLSADELARGVRLISNDNTRQSVLFYEKYHFYNDFYNASFESVIALIRLAESHETNQKKSLLLGDILELGAMSGEIHFNIGKSISPLHFHNVFLYGNESQRIRLGAIENGFPNERIYINPNTSDPELTATQIRGGCDEGEIIFMKASRGTRLERVLNCFMTKGESDG